MNWFATEEATLIATIEHAGTAGSDHHAAQLPWTLATYFDRRGHWYDWALVQEVAVAASERLPDQRVHAQALRLLENAYSNLRRYDDAHHALRRALAIFERLDDEGGRAHVHFDIALLYDREGHPADALDHARRPLGCYRAVGNRLGEAVALNAVGWYSCELGDYHTAVTCCQQFLALATEIDSAYGRSNSLDSLGYAHARLGEHATAVDCYRQAIDLFREMGDRHAEAIALDHLGDAHQAMSNRRDAAAAWRQAFAMLDEFGHPDADSVRAKLAGIAAPGPHGRDLVAHAAP